MLVPILYSIYTSPITDIISKHNMNHHFYADDSQIHLSFKPTAAGDPSTSKLRIEFQPVSWCSITTKLSSLFCTPVIDHNPARIYSCLLRCDLLIELGKEHRCVVRQCNVYGQTNKQHMSVCSLPPAQHCSNQWTYLFPSLWNFDPRIRNIQDWPL